jgi:hypothetical protein
MLPPLHPLHPFYSFPSCLSAPSSFLFHPFLFPFLLQFLLTFLLLVLETSSFLTIPSSFPSNPLLLPSYISSLLYFSTSSFSFPSSFLPQSIPHSLLPSFTPSLSPYLHPFVHSPSLLQEILYCTVFSCQVSFSQNANSFLPLILPYVNFIKSLLTASCVPNSLCHSLFSPSLYIFLLCL